MLAVLLLALLAAVQASDSFPDEHTDIVFLNKGNNLIKNLYFTQLDSIFTCPGGATLPLYMSISDPKQHLSAFSSL